ncbi:MAG: 16S rRNA (cytidine(1402)-2'-O)-methyltransferase [Myxococcota bacterium]
MSTLFVVATPLGNLEDISPRARRVLDECDVVFAEDTRRTRSLLQHLGIQRALSSLHEHNERERADQLVALLEQGKSVALVSDAGTPVVSDPGDAVVASVLAAGFRVSPVAGPSAWAAAISVSGFSAQNSLFVGFVPHKGRARSEALERICAHSGTVVLFESPHRAEKTLAALAEAQPERPAAVCRELTKLHEEVVPGTLSALSEWAAGPVKGELTVVLGPFEQSTGTPEDAQLLDALRRCQRAGLSARDAAAAVAAVLDVPRRSVYQQAQSSGFWE